MRKKIEQSLFAPLPDFKLQATVVRRKILLGNHEA